jgi:four helix bundle protein
MKRGHKNPDVWRESVALATSVYRVTDQSPKTEVYGLTSQMRRAVVSVPSNTCPVKYGEAVGQQDYLTG